MPAIHAAMGSGAENRAFGLTRRTRVPTEATEGAFAIWEEEIPAGAGPPLHVHEREHEVFTVISGRVRFVADGREHDAGPGDVMMIPPGVPHTFQGKEDAVATVMLTPGAASNFFAAVTEAGVDPATDMDAVIRIAADHNIRFVGPPLD
ncbi:cupin domain-containing protein [Jannaschia ovalis]|uniref:Cupin domain-containing protein n=1 Tax=Jannaschia ovalis TaxID=3038773 RepID=A0ABY8LF08_9RHOB|nr:cupin domain-containing protein [Jannaschia sp. GRR-S6-38]WGH79884.1 cupin domain-containing protein [Jannaschia sp. GRR-S6-38]